MGLELGNVNQNIKNYLQVHGISQSFLAKKSGLSVMAMSALMQGKRKLSAEEYVAICNALQVPVETFL